MKTFLGILLILSAAIASAKGNRPVAKTAPQPQASAQGSLSTDITFDGSTVHGRYNTADEATATVEDEKMLNRLLGVRLDFKDRLQTNSGQR
ncbi:MAG: hypothetical protein IT288_12625 [Bdellovibrionales bacterium]|nr:hypothetical protein [Bdellovibrionales bacterium]